LLRPQINAMKTKKHILVPIDFSQLSIQAVDLAKNLASASGATVHLAHVHQLYSPAGLTATMPLAMPFSVPDYEQEIEKRRTNQLRELAAQHQLQRPVCHICTGAPAYDELCNLAKEIPADLIVMPTHGHTGLKHLFLGSTAERVIQHAPCPVLVTRQLKGRPSDASADLPARSILVPVDFSDCSVDGLAYAIDFAKEFGAKIIVQHVVDLGPIYMADSYGVYDLSKYREMVRVNAKQQMREFVQLAKFGSVPFEAVVTIGSAVWEICDLAENRRVDLIITSTHGRTGFEHVLIGSTAEQVVRHAPCSVLVVPSHPKTRTENLLRRSIGTGKTMAGTVRTTPRAAVQTKRLTRKYWKQNVHAFPERRATNKFRESHLVR